MRNAPGRRVIHAKNRNTGPDICTPGPPWETHRQVPPVVGPGDLLRPHSENHRLNASRWQERKSRSGGSRATGWAVRGDRDVPSC